MNDTAQIITASATLLAVLGGLILQFLQLRNSHKNSQAIADVKSATNGMAKRLEVAAEAKGNLQGRKDEKADNEAAR